MDTEAKGTTMSQNAMVLDNGTQVLLSKSDRIQTEYAPHFTALTPVIEEAKAIQVTDATQVTAIKAARAVRLKLRAIRTSADKTREALKAESLRTGREIQDWYNKLAALCEPEEKRLQEAEDFAERAEAARIAALQAERSTQLRAFVADVTPYTTLGTMAAPAWEQLLQGQRLAHEAAAEAQRKAEAERLAKIEADRIERERVVAENARLKAEADRVEAERRAEAAKAQAEREEAQRKLDAERKAAQEAADAERRKVEAEARRKQAEADAAIKAEKERAAKAQAELDRTRLAEQARAKAEADAARRAAAAPDAEKVRAYAAKIKAVDVPQIEGDEHATRMSAIVSWTVAELAKLADRMSQ